MDKLQGKKILLGVTGGIAAYKSAELLRLLTKSGAEVRVVMTEAAQQFIQPLTFQALSGHRVYTDIFDAEADSAMDHIDLARWCDLFVVAPASADFIAKFRQGYGDTLIHSLCLAAGKDIAIAPAMNQQMYASPATQENIQELESRGVYIWGPDAGEQACGEIGLGRMSEPSAILQSVLEYFSPRKLDGKRIVITAGPTREAIDPVRYISNHSSGKMGYALAKAAVQAGASVELVSGPVGLKRPQQVNLTSVISADEMYEAVMQRISDCDIFIGCAAVADYKLADIADQKMKKSDQLLMLNLIPNPDILHEVSHLESRPFCVGFAAETENVEEYARQKLKKKNLDMIAANQVGSSTTGFSVDTNELQVYWNIGSATIPIAKKSRVAHELIELVGQRFLQK